jgi:hypothetical protein
MSKLDDLYLELSEDSDIKNIIDSDHIFTMDLPDQTNWIEIVPIMLITEVNNNANLFASNRIKQKAFKVQVQLWIPKDVEDPDLYGNLLEEKMTDLGFGQYYDDQRTDPSVDNSLIMITQGFTKSIFK